MSDKIERKTTVGILQTGRLGGALAVRYGEYPDMFMELFSPAPFEYKTYAVIDGKLPKHALECDSWVITGSKHGVYEDFDWIKPLETFIRKLIVSGQPTVGICFGHQIMAQAMGGKVEKFQGGWGVGLRDYTDLASDQKVRLMSFHQDQVVFPPQNTQLLLTSGFCPYAGLRYSPTCFSLQPHPEHSAAFMADLINQRRSVQLSAEEADDALTALNEPNDQARYGQWIADVLAGKLRL
jgi:GMP synthase (glutamine-hydrolysing)